MCFNCNKKINLKEGSYPLKKSFSFACPACKSKIKVPAQNKPSAKNNMSPDLYGQALKKKILEETTAIPPLPEVLVKAKETIADPLKSIKDLGQIIGLDQGIAGRVLKLANSVYYSRGNPIPTIDEACMILGEEIIMGILLVAQMSKLLDKPLEGYNIAKGNLFYHSIAVAVAANIISHEKMPLLDYDSFAAGLMHDCGKIALDQYLKPKQNEFKTMITIDKIKCYEAETTLFGFSHADLGAALLESWGLPEIQPHAICFHHHPLNSNNNELAYILHVADYIAVQAEYQSSSFCHEEVFEVNKDVLNFLEIDELEMEGYLLDVRQRVEELTNDFSVEN